MNNASTEAKNISTVSSISYKTATSVAFCLLVLFWGLYPVVTKLAVQDAPPLLFSSARMGIAACIVALVSKLILHERLRLTWNQYWKVFLIGILIAGVPTGAFAVALKSAPAGTISVMWATFPIFTALFNVGEDGEIRGWRLIASLVIGFIGVVIVITGSFPSLSHLSLNTSFIRLTHASSAIIGELAVLVSAALSGLALRLAKESVREIPVATLTVWEVLSGGSFLAVMSVLFEWGQPFHLTWGTLGTLFYASAICSCGCNMLTFWLLRRIGAIRTTYSDFLVPGVALFLSFILMGESLTLAKIGGLLLILLGAILSLVRTH